MSGRLFDSGAAEVQRDLDRARKTLMPVGPYTGMTLGEICRRPGGMEWLAWFLAEGVKSVELRRAIERVLGCGGAA